MEQVYKNDTSDSITWRIDDNGIFGTFCRDDFGGHNYRLISNCSLELQCLMVCTYDDGGVFGSTSRDLCRDLDLCDLLGTLETSLSGLSTRNDLRMVRAKGNEESATIVTRLWGFMGGGKYGISHFSGLIGRRREEVLPHFSVFRAP